MYVCMYVRMYVCMYVRMYVCTYVRMYVFMYVWSHLLIQWVLMLRVHSRQVMKMISIPVIIRYTCVISDVITTEL